MKAKEFVKAFGVEAAKEFLDLPSYSIDQLMMLQSGLRCEDLQRLVELHENLELLGGIKKGKEILDGAPVGSDGFVLWTGKVRYLNGSTKCIFSDKSNEWSPANVMVLNLMISFDALKDLIADVEACQ